MLSWRFTLTIPGGRVLMPAIRAEDRAEAERTVLDDAARAGFEVLGIAEATRCDPSIPLGRNRDWRQGSF